jgi:protoporphyrinogen oxidase
VQKVRIVVLGGGPAGLGAAYKLAQRGFAEVTLLEQSEDVGGTAGSFELAGTRVDYGSHRLHRACDPEVLSDIRNLLGDDLLDRPRHGRIRLRQRWIHFPLKPLDLARRLPPGFSVAMGTDVMGKIMPRRIDRTEEEDFASVLEARLGRTICRDFYFPYARKLWGLAPEELSATQARRRVAASSLPQMMRKVLSALPGFKTQGSGRFFYPRHGFGQMAQALAQAAREAGAEIRLNAPVRGIQMTESGPHTVCYQEHGRVVSVQADHVWSTIPITALVHHLTPMPPADCLQAAEAIEYQGMILVYLVLEQRHFSEYDAHYFPGADIPITRLSEPKNYSNSESPSDRTVLCAELPCSLNDAEWARSDEDLGRLVLDALAAAEIPRTGTGATDCHTAPARGLSDIPSRVRSSLRPLGSVF